MKKILLDDAKSFFKGNMHCHSTLSDGKMTPEELKAHYKARGYHFLAITDHDHINDNSYLNDESFLTITSGEFAVKEFPEQSTLKNQKMKCAHFNFYAKRSDTVDTPWWSPVYDHYSKGERREELQRKYDNGYRRIYSAEGINAFVRMANEAGYFVVYNHPRWSLENYKQYSQYEGLWGVEVYNHACHIGGMYEYDINVHDDFLRDGKRIFLSVGDDNHKEEHCGGAWVCVNAESLTYENIIDALLAGDFYVSRGPEIHGMYVEDGRLYVKTSEAAMISFSTEGRRHGAVRAAEGESVCEAVFDLREDDGYVRVSVEDARGRRADSQAYFIEDLL